MARYPRILAWLLPCALFCPGLAVYAHDLGVSPTTLTEDSTGTYRLTVTVPRALAHLIGPPMLPTGCRLGGSPAGFRGSSETTFEFSCPESPLKAGDTLTLPWIREGILLSVTWADGSTASRFIPRSGSTITVDLATLQAGSGSFTAAMQRYTALGIEHILSGFDHLLFVFGLLLLASGTWMLVKTITSFTVAHSITLALATLGFVSFPRAAVEVTIALSIVFVAVEALRLHQGNPGLAALRPWLVAFAFGLLHGFGFAGALSELGLPVSEIPVALLFFNIGVEIGQIVFVAAILLMMAPWRRYQHRLPHWGGAVPGYFIGTLATFWLADRLAQLFESFNFAPV